MTSDLHSPHGERVTAPGWYPDPHTGQQRYFDGTQWGPSAPPMEAKGRVTVHYGFVLLAVFSLLGTIIPSVFWFVSAASAQDGTESAATAGGIMSFFGIGWLLWGGMWTIIWAAFAIQHTLKSRRA